MILFSDGCFDGKIVVFRQTVVRVYYILKALIMFQKKPFKTVVISLSSVIIFSFSTNVILSLMTNLFGKY